MQAIVYQSFLSWQRFTVKWRTGRSNLIQLLRSELVIQVYIVIGNENENYSLEQVVKFRKFVSHHLAPDGSKHECNFEKRIRIL